MTQSEHRERCWPSQGMLLWSSPRPRLLVTPVAPTTLSGRLAGRSPSVRQPPRSDWIDDAPQADLLAGRIRPDAVICCPATFNTLNKWAAGINDSPGSWRPQRRSWAGHAGARRAHGRRAALPPPGVAGHSRLPGQRRRRHHRSRRRRADLATSRHTLGDRRRHRQMTSTPSRSSAGWKEAGSTPPTEPTQPGRDPYTSAGSTAVTVLARSQRDDAATTGHSGRPSRPRPLAGGASR